MPEPTNPVTVITPTATVQALPEMPAPTGKIEIAYNPDLSLIGTRQTVGKDVSAEDAATAVREGRAKYV